MPQLSIIIPFCNEKEQVEKTVISIIENSITSPEIILIDDASDDFYDYFKIAKKYGCVFVHHANRKGVAGSRNEGVNVSTAANFLFLDAHMKMYEKAFDANLIKLLEENDKCVLCAQTISIDEQHNIINNEVSWGAEIDKYNGFKAKWVYKDAHVDKNIYEIDCILGAGYCMKKEYYLYLHGLNGLECYGCDEEMLSTKVKKTGGKCLFVKNWRTGHLYRVNAKSNPNPFHRSLLWSCYNRILTVKLCFDKIEEEKIIEGIKTTFEQVYSEANKQIEKKGKWIEEEKKYLESIFIS